jgi:hypothetical protein
MAANLTPRMSELEVIDATGSHYLNYIQCALLSANVRTIQAALYFLSKLQIMEDGEERMNSSCGNALSRSGQDTSASQNQNGNYRQRPQPRSVRYTRYRYNRQNDQQATSRVQQTDTLQQRQQGKLDPEAESYNPRRAISWPQD